MSRIRALRTTCLPTVPFAMEKVKLRKRQVFPEGSQSGQAGVFGGPLEFRATWPLLCTPQLQEDPAEETCTRMVLALAGWLECPAYIAREALRKSPWPWAKRAASETNRILVWAQRGQ